MKTLYIIDAYSYLYRAFYIAPLLTNPQGILIGATYLYTNMLLKLLREHKPSYCVVAYDNAKPTLRKQLYPNYKGGRSRNEELAIQFPIARDASRALGFANLEADGFEADDIAATLVRLAEISGDNIVLISPDKDWLQLLSPAVALFDPMKEKYISADDVYKKFGVYPNRLRDLLALAGDLSDNIPGVPGVGLKKAARLIKDYGDMEGVLRNAGEITQPQLRYNLERFADLARLSYNLVGLHFDAPIHLHLEDTKVLYHREQARDFCDLHDFKSLLARI